MKIAVVGCCHGELDKIYDSLAQLEKSNNIKIDLLLICGDFQAVRNMNDLKTMAVPLKYQKLNTFYKYYSGAKVAPVLTLFIGGNHEASGYLQELPYGGWVARNIYYLGYAGVVQFGGLRIAGVSGIYKDRDFYKGHYERPPYNENTKRSCYHMRNIEVLRLKQYRKPIDIFMSHDWPQGIYNYGNADGLLKRKPYFRQEVMSRSLGNPAAEELLFSLKPSYWFSAHLHCKFSAVVGHVNEDGSKGSSTKFLALDKCLPHKQFLQVLDIESPSGIQPMHLHLDSDWLHVLKSTNHLFSLKPSSSYFQPEVDPESSLTEDELENLKKVFGDSLAVPDNFVHTAPPIPSSTNDSSSACSNNCEADNINALFVNPQTELICKTLGLVHPFDVFKNQSENVIEFEEMDTSAVHRVEDDGCSDDEHNCSSTLNSTMMSYSSVSFHEKSYNPDEINLDDDDDDDCSEIADGKGSLPVKIISPDEINLDDILDDNDDGDGGDLNSADDDNHGDKSKIDVRDSIEFVESRTETDSFIEKEVLSLKRDFEGRDDYQHPLFKKQKSESPPPLL